MIRYLVCIHYLTLEDFCFFSNDYEQAKDYYDDFVLDKRGHAGISLIKYDGCVYEIIESKGIN